VAKKKLQTSTQLRVRVLAALRRVPACEGAADVTIRFDRTRPEYDWAIADCDPGTAKVVDCKRALGAIQALFQQMYELEPVRELPAGREREKILLHNFNKRKAPAQMPLREPVAQPVEERPSPCRLDAGREQNFPLVPGAQQISE
jgi:hypothetical protein